MKSLSQDQKDIFWRDGFLVVENAVTRAELNGLRTTFLEWVEESRLHFKDFGETIDGRKRFDLQPGQDARSQLSEEYSRQKKFQKIMFMICADQK